MTEEPQQLTFEWLREVLDFEKALRAAQEQQKADLELLEDDLGEWDLLP